VAERTEDPVLDSWFSILFSFAAFQSRQPCTIAVLSCLVSPLPSLSMENIKRLIPTALNDLCCFNYWHLLDFIYFPLMIDGDHWILIRVGIQTKMVDIFDSLGLIFEDKLQKVSISSTMFSCYHTNIFFRN